MAYSCNVASIIGLALIVSACSSRPEPGIKIQYVDKPVIVTEKCIKKADRPERPKSLKENGLPADLEKALALSLAKISEYTRYSNKTEAILSDCTQ